MANRRRRPAPGLDSGKLPGGEAFDGPDELKAILLVRKDPTSSGT